jgi:plastocyanin
MPTRDIYLKIEVVPGYSPVMPTDHATPPVQYGRDCMRNMGHEDGSIPPDEMAARRLTALVYREYLDPQYLVPKPDKLVAADINEPPYAHRVPGTVIYASPGDRLRIHIKNDDGVPHSFHVHGLRYGIDSDGAWPMGTQSADGRRSDEICSGQKWTYTYDIDDDMMGAWPFHDHCRNIGANADRGLFGGVVVLPREEIEDLPRFPCAEGFLEEAVKLAHSLRPRAGSAVSAPTAASMADTPIADDSGAGMSAGTPMRGVASATTHHVNLSAAPEALVPVLATLEELAHAPQELPCHDEILHVPLFFHQMNGPRDTPIFQSAPLSQNQSFSFTFTLPGSYPYICGIHGAMMSGSVTVANTGPTAQTVTIADFMFTPAEVTIAVGGTVTWINTVSTQHSLLETGDSSLASVCFNGRSFVGNTPTIVAHSGQRIHWYVFNLDLSMGWHNFHPHSQRWRFAGQPVDVRSIGPAESFVVETTAPPVLLLPEAIAQCQEPDHRPRDAKPYRLRGGFLFHCHVEMHMMGGLAGLVRSHQTVWLTDAQRHELETTVGLPLDPGGNSCPTVVADRCANSSTGSIEELPNLPGITFMHALLLPGSDRIVFWGYGQTHDQARLWDQATGMYPLPANQPLDVAADENIWSSGQAHLNDATGTILVCGGFQTGTGVGPGTERRSFLFDPATNTFSATADMASQRFYPTTIPLADGKVMALYGSVTSAANSPVSSNFEIFDPAGAGGTGTWSAPTHLPFNYLWYPWTFLLPDGELFIAGPQKPARRFDYTATPVVDDPARQYNQVYPQRGVNMDGTAVLLPLRPPNYQPQVLIAGGSSSYWSGTNAGALNTAEWIDLSAASPTWTALPNMNIPRDHLQSVLLPDGRVVFMGGTDLQPGGGPIEIFDPEDPQSGFELGPSLAYTKTYHSAAILMRDGSVIIGGDTGPFQGGATTPNERYLPSYFFKPRPVISAAPPLLNYGAPFAVPTPDPNTIAEVVLMRPGAVTHAFNHDQCYVGCAITGAAGGSVQATAPPDGHHAPPGHYLLFLVDHDRVPSEGVWVRLF